MTSRTSLFYPWPSVSSLVVQINHGLPGWTQIFAQAIFGCVRRIAFLALALLPLTAGVSQPNCATAEDEDAAFQPEDKLVGLGIELKSDKGALQVMKVVPGGPAERADILQGDRIVAIDGHSLADLSAADAAKLLQGKVRSYVTVTAVTGREQPRQLRIRRESIDFVTEDVALNRLRAVAMLKAEKDLHARINANLDHLRDPLANEIRFMAKVGQLTPEEIESLKRDGALAIERHLRPMANGGAGRLVRRRVVVVNGKPELREDLNERPQASVRRELTPVLKAISFAAWEKFDAERERLERRQREADVLVQVAAFDEALLLTNEQREKLCKLLSARWTDVWRGRVNDNTSVDPAQLCVTAASAMDLFSIPDVELLAVLRPNQIAAFKLVQLPTKLEAVFVQETLQQAQVALNNAGLNNGAAALERRFGAGRILRQGVPLNEERQRLELFLQRLVDDADAHASLDGAQKQKLLLAGKLDLGKYFEQQVAICEPPSGSKVFVVAQGQIAGVKVQLPPILSGVDSVLQKTLRRRLSPEQLAKIADAEHKRGRFHRRAVLHVLTSALAQSAALTDGQAEQVEHLLAERLNASGDANNLDGWRRNTLRLLTEPHADEIKALVDAWQWPAARDCLIELAATARSLETQLANDSGSPEEALLGIPAAP